MADVTIEKLASDVNTTVDRIIQQFADAGITKQVGQMVNEEEKKTLLDHLSRAHGGQSAEPSKLTLVRKEKTTLSVAGGAGRNREIQVEVRKQKLLLNVLLAKKLQNWLKKNVLLLNKPQRLLSANKSV